jgi:dynein heavy chain 1
LAIELHLESEIVDEASLEAINKFVNDSPSSGGEDETEAAASIPPRLFVWVPKDSENALASTERLDAQNMGAIAFVHSSGNALQCMTIQPRVYQEEEKKESENDEQQKGEEAEVATTTLDALQLFARYCFVPAVQAMEETSVEGEAAATSQQQQDTKSKRLLEGVQDKIRELDVALGQYRRSAFSQIPTITLAVHADIAKAVEQHGGSSTSDFEALGLADKLQDDEFLNDVQSGVSQWIVQIRKVTVLPATTPFPSLESSSAPDLEEVSFWTQLEAALEHVQSELQKPTVEVTLNLLKAAKRFLATIALDNNSGLEAAMAHTSDVCHYLRNYPSLETATDFDKMATTMNAVFDHLPKVRSSRYYDLERSAKLLQASTFTLQKRMISVLQENASNILWMDFTEYENKVRYPTQDVFVQFDDRYEQFSEFFLEQGRKRKMASGKTPSQVLKELTLYHAPLQQRLDVLHEFRANHQLLHTVVTQVLKDETGTDAIRQVESAPRTIFASLDLLDLSPGGTIALERALEEYERQMDAMEERLARLLRDKLTACEVRVLVALYWNDDW